MFTYSKKGSDVCIGLDLESKCEMAKGLGKELNLRHVQVLMIGPIKGQVGVIVGLLRSYYLKVRWLWTI